MTHVHISVYKSQNRQKDSQTQIRMGILFLMCNFDQVESIYRNMHKLKWRFRLFGTYVRWG